MADYMTLMGTEDVQRAGSQMSSAAADMIRAASYIDEILVRHQIWADDWLLRLEKILVGEPEQGREEKEDES